MNKGSISMPSLENGSRAMFWALLAVAAVLFALIFNSAIVYTVQAWSQEEYSHGYLIPFIALFLIWRQRAQILAQPFEGSWFGVAVVAAACCAALAGTLATVHGIVRFSVVIALVGCVLAVVGWRGMRPMWAPMAYLLFMIPLPLFIYYGLSSQLQLISSQLGVAVIRLFGVSVYLEGNVIDLGAMQLQVVEACSGLRYLFPLMSFAFLLAYLGRCPRWVKVLVFLSSIPATVFLNSFRIGVTGVMVEYYGQKAAEGFFHDFEGWIVFMGGIAIMVTMMWALTRLSGVKGPLFDLDSGAPVARGVRPVYARSSTHTGYALIAVLLATYAAAFLMPLRKEFIPARETFGSFPLAAAEWHGQRQRLEHVYLDALQLDDYLLADYSRAKDSGSVNFYVAYYASQKGGAATHSPKGCLPGSGWEMNQFAPHTVPDSRNGGQFALNRAVMTKGKDKLLVYYWFEERGRRLTSEYGVKAMIFWDAITKGQTNGALVRLTTPVGLAEPIESADERLEQFLSTFNPLLSKHLPAP